MWTRFSKWLKLALFLFISIIFSNSTFATPDKKQDDIRTLIEQAKDAWVARDADALAQLFAADGELIVPGERWLGQAKIRAEIARFAQHYSSVKIDIRRIIVEGNQAVVEWHYEDTEKATGLRNKADDAIVVDFKNGKISRWREYFDQQTPANKP